MKHRWLQRRDLGEGNNAGYAGDVKFTAKYRKEKHKS